MNGLLNAILEDNERRSPCKKLLAKPCTVEKIQRDKKKLSKWIVET